MAFCLPRSLNAASRFFLSALGGGESELYVLGIQSGNRRTIPALDNLGVISPLWSPNGSKIAVATTNGTFIHPAILDVGSGQMQVVIERNLALPGTRQFFEWLDDDTLACELTPDNMPTLMARYRQARRGSQHQGLVRACEPADKRTGVVDTPSRTGPIIEVECRTCDRAGSYVRVELIKKPGASITFARIRHMSALGCDRLMDADGDRCRTRFPCLGPIAPSS